MMNRLLMVRINSTSRCTLQHDYHYLKALSTMYFSSTNNTLLTKSEDLQKEHDELMNEAKSLSLCLYRTILRTINNIVRYGNEHDEKEFQQREQKRKSPKSKDDIRLSMISMLPPVNRHDELQSRVNYYIQYTRENFIQESDCLNDLTREEHINRYLYHLRRGEEHRIWLLNDMKFNNDIYSNYFPYERVNNFEQRAYTYIQNLNNYYNLQQQREEEENVSLSSEQSSLVVEENNNNNNNASKEHSSSEKDDKDGWSSDEDDDEEGKGLPSWYKNPRSQ